jgi:hypothetical protein
VLFIVIHRFSNIQALMISVKIDNCLNRLLERRTAGTCCAIVVPLFRNVPVALDGDAGLCLLPSSTSHSGWIQ